MRHWHYFWFILAVLGIGSSNRKPKRISFKWGKPHKA